MAVFFLDMDRFKLVNDSLGHEVGDRMLVAVAERLSACLRPGDSVARFGGDEFTILLAGLSDPDHAIRVAERITAQLRQPVVLGEHELFVSASIGIALSHGGQERASDLLRQADVAMYLAKEKGRSRFEVFDSQSAPQVMDRLEFETDLWRAIDHKELVIHFQPEIDLATGRVVSAEALARWQHPRRGPAGARRVRARSRRSRASSSPIDRFVLREACTWARRWSQEREDGEPLVVSVNLSPRFMRQPDVVADITAALRETEVDPRCIQLEITERSALTDLDNTCSQLHELRALGVRIAIDDFGTGYSSLSYLKRLPIDTLKLDRSFLDRHRHRPGRPRHRAGRDHDGSCARDEGHRRGRRAPRGSGAAARSRLRRRDGMAVVEGSAGRGPRGARCVPASHRRGPSTAASSCRCGARLTRRNRRSPVTRAAPYVAGGRQMPIPSGNCRPWSIVSGGSGVPSGANAMRRTLPVPRPGPDRCRSR